jgi:hypothetical protein
LREENDERPRPGLAPSCRLAMCSSWGLTAFLGRTAGMLRIRFYNRRLLTSTRRETRSSETARRTPWEDPPSFRFEIRRENGVF